MKTHYTTTEYKIICQLLTYLRSGIDRDEQKKIRGQLRRQTGLYISELGIKTLDDFERLRQSGVITVGDDDHTLPVRSQESEGCLRAQTEPSRSMQESKQARESQIDWNDLENLKAYGFTGFQPIRELRQNLSLIPKTQGVYLVLRDSSSQPMFRKKGSGGFFKGKNPNLPIPELENHWVENTKVVYIGKAGGGSSSATLKSRLHQLFKFGAGKKAGHWGGRLIWQLDDAEDLLVAWIHSGEVDAQNLESHLIQLFKHEHEGKRPFANLKD